MSNESHAANHAAVVERLTQQYKRGLIDDFEYQREMLDYTMILVNRVVMAKRDAGLRTKPSWLYENQ